ncbi:hypothetical protein O6H91_05G094500 [Diphasiastrum complanatum]|uniref:Uncharacterized protein n=1 Tax=Diphasiastrum complanatum TaxID=34168 RepID=A0ACC2DR05_DIPCM|nr:hypothetical protein O6H91_05G094500 [Diphasiastrum complanatum]
MAFLWRNKETRTLVLVNLAAIMEKADESLLPGVYRELGLQLHASPASLGSLTLLRSLTQTLCFPLAAYLAVHHDRASVIALGAFLWAIATLCVGISSTFLQVAISRALNGIGLAVVIPAIQSLVADGTDETNRGLAFGWLQLTGNLGSVVGGLCAVLLAGTSIFGISGWRISFLLVAIVSVIVGILVYLFAIDPRISRGQIPIQKERRSEGTSILWADVKELLAEARKVIGIRTFQILVAQGVVGTFPWAALAFAPMWLELIGFNHGTTAVLLGTFIVASSIGGLFGGRLGDILSKKYPNSGRIILSQVSSGLGVPLAAILLLLVHATPSAKFVYGVLFFTLGFATSWNAAATNNPIFAEIVPERSRTSIYALDRSFESVLASFAPPIVGLLAEKVYGYVPTLVGLDRQAAVNMDRANAVSLAKALYTAYAIPLAKNKVLRSLSRYCMENSDPSKGPFSQCSNNQGL